MHKEFQPHPDFIAKRLGTDGHKKLNEILKTLNKDFDGIKEYLQYVEAMCNHGMMVASGLRYKIEEYEKEHSGDDLGNN